jgi:hypothetical protein
VDSRTRSQPWIEPGHPLAWTFAAGFVMLVSAFIALAVFELFPRMTPPACEMQLRIVLSFVIPAGTGAALLPVAMTRLPPGIRAVIGTAAGVAAIALAWFLTSRLFPSYC